MMNPGDTINVEQEDSGFPLPHFEDTVRYLGISGIDVIPPLDLIILGFTDTNRIEYYLGDRAGDYYIRLLPHHSLREIGWKNQYAAAKENKDIPGKPHNCIWTNNGFMYNIKTFFERQHEHIMNALYEEVLSKIDLFAGCKKHRKEDPWA